MQRALMTRIVALSLAMGAGVALADETVTKPDAPAADATATKPKKAKKAAASAAALAPAAVQALYDRVRPSLVAVQYTYSGELGRQDIIGPGIVVGSEGVILTSMSMFPVQIPNE